MSGRNNFKWAKSYGHRLENAVEQFNRLRASTMRRDPAARDWLPGKADYNALKQSINSSDDLQRVINSLERFNSREARQVYTTRSGVTISQWEKREIGIQASVANRRFARETRQNLALDVTVGGKAAGFKRGQMPTAREAEFSMRNYDIEKVRPQDWNAFKEKLKRQSAREYMSLKKEIMRSNYIKKLNQVFGEDRARRLVDKIRSMDAGAFVKKAMSEELADFGHAYIVEAQGANFTDAQWEDELGTLEAVWGAV